MIARLICAPLLALLIAPWAYAADPAWIAEPVDRTTWTSTSVWRPSAVVRATRAPDGITVQVTCAVENGRRTTRLHYFDLDRVGEHEWQASLVARIDGTDAVEIEHVFRADWQSPPLSSATLARLRAGGFLVIERRGDPLRLQLTGMREALDRLDGMCVPS